DVELLGQRLEAGGDLGDFLHADVGAPAAALQKLDIVDHQEIETALALQATGPGGELCDGEAAGLVHEERQVLQFDRDVLDALELVLADAAAPDRARRNLRAFGDDTRGELLGRHFE